MIRFINYSNTEKFEIIFAKFQLALNNSNDPLAAQYEKSTAGAIQNQKSL